MEAVLLTETEKRYAPIELEALAIAYAVEKCGIFLKGGPKFEIWTDHKPLESIFKKHYVEVNNPRVKRFMERITSMEGFDFEVRWVEGKSHEIADALSRYPVENGNDVETGQVNRVETNNNSSNNNLNLNFTPTVAVTTVFTKSLEKIVESANTDVDYREMIRQIRSGEKPAKWGYGYNLKNIWNDLSIGCNDSLIVLNNSRIVIPIKYRKQILELCHKGHPGETRMKRIAKALYYWPKMNADVEQTVKTCQICQQNLPLPVDNSKKQGSTALYPMEMVSTDMFNYEGKDYLIVMDRFTGYIWTKQLKESVNGQSYRSI